MNKLLKYLTNSDFYKDFMQNITTQSDINVINSNDAINTFLAAAYFNDIQENMIIVTPNIYSAQKVYEKMTNMLSTDVVAFFPQDEFMTTEMLAMSAEFKLERIDTIKRIIDNEKLIIITNTTGFIKNMIPLKEWEKALIKLKVGDVINVNEFVEKLVQMGYIRQDMTENQGEFSLRGSIIDIYPLNEQNPIRIDLFDDEVDSIRYFDLSTQRSSIKVSDVEIVPMYEFFYNEETVELIKEKVRSKMKKQKFDEKSSIRIENELEQLELHHEIDNLYRYMSLVYEKLETLSDYISNKHVIFWDHKRIKENYDNVIQDINDWYHSTKDYPKMGFNLVKDIEHIYNGKSLYLNVFGDSIQSKNSINIRSKEPVKYNSNLHLLISDLKKYNGYTTTIINFKDKKSLTNFSKIISDKVSYQIVGEKDDIIPKTTNLVVTDIDNSVDFFNINTVFLSEEWIFKQKTHKKAKFKSSIKDSKKISTVEELKKGDYIVHYDHGIGRFLGVKQMTLGDSTNDYVHISYKGDDSLYIPVENIHLIQKYVGTEGKKPIIHKLDGTTWAKTKQRVRKRVKDIADKLIKLYAAREEAKGFAFSPESDLQTEFEIDFPYQETPDQLKAIKEIKDDMESTKPMDRLLCGDVGYGKTEVAMRAAFKAVLDNKQVAYLAPTTVLSRQHFYTFKERFDRYGIKIGLLNRFVTKSVQRKVIERASIGEIDIIIGTHRILSKDMVFNDLGLLIIDEEQRFGVEHKEIIKEMKVNIDVLSLSATPIPRTLQMAIMGVKSMSLLETPPLNRYPIQTYVLERNDSIIRDAIQREMARNGQIFYLYNRVDDIDMVANRISRLCPEARVISAHGKMSRLKLEEVITAFIDGEYDVLVSTTIIETGIDIPNANTLIVHDADQLGLSQLYQIRGRVGRSDKIAYAYLMYQKNKQLNEEAVKRLKVIKEFTELGSGFKIAIRDLAIRGAGDVLGTEQSGFMDSVGMDLFLDMLKDEIELKQSGKEPTKETKPNIKVRVNKYIDSNYIQNDYIKIEMHKKIANIKSKQDIDVLFEEFKDRFGVPSEEIIIYMYEKLFEYLAEQKGIVRVRETKNNMIFILSKEASKNINGEYLFEKAYDISKFIRFTYRLEQLNIIIDTIKLERHYIYYIVDLLEIL